MKKSCIARTEKLSVCCDVPHTVKHDIDFRPKITQNFCGNIASKHLSKQKHL